ncbi:hypothetical protein HK105_208857 [Polyrhizophydium stewartii]|uniref:Uncharacterized protein n=1 Tax=Polyrhizophydium stewartii TaxID=2732419 RepID=A0ABR4MWK3_9FUNG
MGRTLQTQTSEQELVRKVRAVFDECMAKIPSTRDTPFDFDDFVHSLDERDQCFPAPSGRTLSHADVATARNTQSRATAASLRRLELASDSTTDSGGESNYESPATFTPLRRRMGVQLDPADMAPFAQPNNMDEAALQHSHALQAVGRVDPLSVGLPLQEISGAAEGDAGGYAWSPRSPRIAPVRVSVRDVAGMDLDAATHSYALGPPLPAALVDPLTNPTIVPQHRQRRFRHARDPAAASAALAAGRAMSLEEIPEAAIWSDGTVLTLPQSIEDIMQTTISLTQTDWWRTTGRAAAQAAETQLLGESSRERIGTSSNGRGSSSGSRIDWQPPADWEAGLIAWPVSALPEPLSLPPQHDSQDTEGADAPSSVAPAVVQADLPTLPLAAPLRLHGLRRRHSIHSAFASAGSGPSEQPNVYTGRRGSLSGRVGHAYPSTGPHSHALATPLRETWSERARRVWPLAVPRHAPGYTRIPPAGE